MSRSVLERRRVWGGGSSYFSDETNRTSLGPRRERTRSSSSWSHIEVNARAARARARLLCTPHHNTAMCEMALIRCRAAVDRPTKHHRPSVDNKTRPREARAYKHTRTHTPNRNQTKPQTTIICVCLNFRKQIHWWSQLIVL